MDRTTLLDKIGSYEIFNNLLPGVLFCYFVNIGTRFTIPSIGFLEDLFVFYFSGMVISRIGSLVVEGALRKCKFVKYAEDADYYKASQENEFIRTLSETNNTYRSLTSLFFVLLLTKIVDICLYDVIIQHQIGRTATFFILSGSALVLFLFSYRKQTGYVKKRVEQHISAKTDSEASEKEIRG